MSARTAVFARPPVAGRVKQRLTAGLGVEPTLALYRAMLADTVAAASAASADERWIYWSEAPESDMTPPGFVARVQRGADLGARLTAAFEELLRDDGDRAVIVGADCPALDAACLDRALELARGDDVVLGPASDGGYYLIALARPAPEILEGIEWGGPTVLRTTLERARAAGRRVHTLELKHDIDTPADVLRLIRSALTGSLENAAHTLAALRAMNLLPPE